MALGAHEDVGQAMPNVIAKASADVLHEVIAAGEINASGAAAGAKDIEAVAGDADTGKKVETDFLGHFGLEEHVDVSEDGAIFFVAKVVCLVIPPGGFNVKAEAMFEGDDVSSEAGIDPAFFGRRLEGHHVGGRCERLEDIAADQDVALLGRGEVGEQAHEPKNGTRG